MVGYGRRPTFEPFAPGQKSMAERIRWNIVHTGGALRRAAQDENMLQAWLDDEEEANRQEEARKQAWDEVQQKVKRMNERAALAAQAAQARKRREGSAERKKREGSAEKKKAKL